MSCAISVNKFERGGTANKFKYRLKTITLYKNYYETLHNQFVLLCTLCFSSYVICNYAHCKYVS